jgi:hypothetical protein
MLYIHPWDLMKLSCHVTCWKWLSSMHTHNWTWCSKLVKTHSMSTEMAAVSWWMFCLKPKMVWDLYVQAFPFSTSHRKISGGVKSGNLASQKHFEITWFPKNCSILWSCAWTPGVTTFSTLCDWIQFCEDWGSMYIQHLITFRAQIVVILLKVWGL